MKRSGATLAELLLAIAIAALVAAFAVPSFTELLARQRTVAAVNQIIGAVQMARHAAITFHATIALCPAEGSVCAARDQWHRGAMIFRDVNGNGSREPEEAVITRLPPLREGERIYWRSFRNRSYLQFEGNGITAWQNGSFYYCPADDDPRYAKSLILNAQGRITRSRDGDGDGIDEDARGRPLRCG